jgi:hypothetical protein
MEALFDGAKLIYWGGGGDPLTNLHPLVYYKFGGHLRQSPSCGLCGEMLRHLFSSFFCYLGCVDEVVCF